MLHFNPLTSDDDAKFKNRFKNLNQFYDEHSAFVLAAVCGARDLILTLGNEGTRVMAAKKEDHRFWDETIKVDLVAQNYFSHCIKEVYNNQATLFSEELGRLELGDKSDFYIVTDPFDGSLLYKKLHYGFWYTSLAIYSVSGRPLAAAVCDIITGLVTFTNDGKAFSGRFKDEGLLNVQTVIPSKNTKLSEAVLETYLMKSHRLYPACEIWKPLLKTVKFIVPNGGPAGFSDVARGAADIYLALEEAHIENFSSLPIAWASNTIVTDFHGNALTFEDNIDKRYCILCTSNEDLHRQVLRIIGSIDWESQYAKIQV